MAQLRRIASRLDGTASMSPNTEYAKPYLASLSTAKDALRDPAKSSTPISKKVLSEIFSDNTGLTDAVPGAARPYVLTTFRNNVAAISLDDPQSITKGVLALCDRVRDVDLFGLGICLENREGRPALVRLVTRDLIEARQQQAEQHLERQRAKEQQRRKELEKLEKGKMSPLEMFRTNEFKRLNSSLPGPSDYIVDGVFSIITWNLALLVSYSQPISEAEEMSFPDVGA
ncbi:hypothetical protein EMPG_16880 [Blastomyces silverae]|uniref:Uncharacterized protein n=1 Tax=Blastomyces silverae TaxID=2060906 RepID=A0A0H1B875_9EURO|nr:hypothetical protein EMPG_16880 [Blastomyces silverae]